MLRKLISMIRDVFWGLAALSSVGVYIGSIFVAIHESGIPAAILTFIFPGVAQLFWFVWMWMHYGFNNTYCISVIWTLCSLVVSMLCAFLFAAEGERG